MQHTSLPVSRQKSNDITKAYGNRDQFLTIFNPDLQQEICGNADVCFFGGAPTLGQLNDTYGSKTAAMWLVPQLYNLSEYCGCKDKLEGRPLEECASVIAAEFFYLSVSELMLFFHRCKSGRYGRFYGSIDPIIITSSIRLFLKERILAYEEHEKAEKEKADKEAKSKAVSWEDYCMKEFGKILPHPFLRAEGKPEKEKKQTDCNEVLDFAETIINDTHADNSTRRLMDSMFMKKYGCTPKEYVARHKGGK